MPETLVSAETSPLVLHLHPVIEMTDEQFFEFCQLNRELDIERAATGEIILMPPTGSETGNRNLRLIQQLANWTDKDGTGIAFDSNAGFTLPNGATRSPDASWIKLSRWNALSQEQRERFAPICPDFVIELRSVSDSLQPLKDKMQEYIDNGALLGWLIDRKERKVYVYHPDRPVECLDNPPNLKGEAVLPEFVLDLTKIW